MSILNPLFYAVAWVIMRIHAVLAVPFGASSGWAWGLSIVILVMLLRLIMVPLFVKQVRSQRKMQSHMPQLQEIRKRYKNDKQRLNEETMKFYKENGINPLGGCLPLVAQFPVFWALFDVLRAISEWKQGTKPAYGLTEEVVKSAQQAHIFGATLADRFLFPVPGETMSSRIVILFAVLISAATTYLTMRQSAKRGMLNQTAPDPDQPGAALASTMSKNMMYIAPFFALTGLYWQFGLVIYWVTTNVWTLGQQHFLFRNLPIVESASVRAAAAQAASGSGGTAAKSAAAAKSGTAVKSGTAAKSTAAKSTAAKTTAAKSAAAKSAAAAKSGTAAAKTAAKSSTTDAAGASAKSTTSAPKTRTANVSGAKTSANGTVGSGTTGSSVSSGDSGAGSGARGLLRFGKSKPESEPAPAAPATKVVRQQPVRQTRSKRSGNSGKR